MDYIYEIVNFLIYLKITIPNDDYIDLNLIDIGMDSIKFVQLILLLEQSLNFEYPDEKLLINESNTIRKISQTITETKSVAIG